MIHKFARKQPMQALLKLLKCDTIEDCRRIQKGHLFLRRLGKLSVLFTIAFTLIVNDVIAWCIRVVTSQYDSAMNQYEEVTGSVLFKWTLGWLIDPPPIPVLDQRVITLYRILNFAQFCFFVVTIAWCLRWVYADCRVKSDGGLTFKRLMLIAVVTNALLYAGMRVVIFSFLK